MGGGGEIAVGAYRYALWRVWDDICPRVCFVMLNPSRADACRDDPTLRRCVNFARAWGFGALNVVNLFAFRATSPRDLKRAADPVGPGNDAHLRAAVQSAELTIAAWGNQGALAGRSAAVLSFLPAAHCLGVTLAGQPRHPLYVRADTRAETLYPCA